MKEYIKQRLIEDCKVLGAKLLEDYGEFYPFAFGVIKEKETFVDIMPAEVGDKPSTSKDILTELENTFEELYPEHDFIAVCICVDVLVTDNTTNEKTNCLEIRLDGIDGECTNVYIPYSISNKGKITYNTPYEEGASFHFFSKYNISENIDLETEVFTLKSILARKSNILFVVHDIEDNWQFLNGEDALIEDLEMVSLYQILNYDESLKVTLTLPKGWEAFRKDAISDWEFIKSD